MNSTGWFRGVLRRSLLVSAGHLEETYQSSYDRLNHGSFDSDIYAAGYFGQLRYLKPHGMRTVNSSIDSVAAVCGCASLSSFLLPVDPNALFELAR